MARARTRGAAAGLALLLVAGCASGAASAARTTTTSSTTTTTTAAPTTSTTHPHPARVVTLEAWIPFSQTGSVVLRLPSDHVEAVGYHQSNLDGAQAQSPLPSSPRWFVMGDRERDTNPYGAADVVVEPGTEVRAPVSGTVLGGGSYTLYCKYTDDYLLIDPDSHPGWVVKLLHIQGLEVAKGQRVEAGVTVVAAHAHVLPFASQVEDNTGVPPWPHVHIEVDDPSVPDRPGAPCSG